MKYCEKCKEYYFGKEHKCELYKIITDYGEREIYASCHENRKDEE